LKNRKTLVKVVVLFMVFSIIMPMVLIFIGFSIFDSGAFYVIICVVSAFGYALFKWRAHGFLGTKVKWALILLFGIPLLISWITLTVFTGFGPLDNVAGFIIRSACFIIFIITYNRFPTMFVPQINSVQY